MRLIEYEQSIKDKVDKDVHDQSIYTDLQEMSYMFLRRKKVGDCKKDIEDISHLIAGDIYMSILEGTEFTYYLGYLERIYKNYLRNFYMDREVEVPFDPSLDSNRRLLGNSSIYDYVHIGNKLYLEQISNVIDKIMKESCKYRYNSNPYINLRISLMLSIIRNNLVSFHLDQEQEFYLKILMTKFYTEVKNNGFDLDYHVYINGVDINDRISS